MRRSAGHRAGYSVLSPGDEKIIIEIVELLSDCGVPFTHDDLRHVIMSYLDKKEAVNQEVCGLLSWAGILSSRSGRPMLPSVPGLPVQEGGDL